MVQRQYCIDCAKKLGIISTASCFPEGCIIIKNNSRCKMVSGVARKLCNADDDTCENIANKTEMCAEHVAR